MSLPTTNPPLPTDYMAMEEDSWASGTIYTITAGTTMGFPDTRGWNLPAVYGAGVRRCHIYFAFDLLTAAPNITYGVGVSNPSEIDFPMRPYVGDNYPSAILVSHIGRNEMHRWDEVNTWGGDAPLNLASWTMNPGGVTISTNRAGWPSHAPQIVNGSTISIQVTNIQIYGEMLRK